MEIFYPTMKRALCAILVVVAALVAGCAGKGAHVAGLDAAQEAVGPTTAAAVDSLELAEARYREALSHYVSDEWDEAIPLLERALACLDATHPKVDNLRHARESLRSRVLHFLRTAPGYELPDRPVEVEDHVVEAVRADVLDAAQDSDIPPVEIITNSRVEKWLDYFTGKGRKDMERWLSRTGRYRPMIERELDSARLPRELFYLAMIESGLNPNAYSRAHAAGMWQFISSRARMYGLRVDWWVDERRDPLKATRAACAYLGDLYEMFGSWELALAGYNSGEGRVSKAQSRRPSCPDYWCLDLPRETENFVPKFLAVVMIGSDPEAYGFTDYELETPLEQETIEVSDATDITFIAEAVGTSQDEIEKLNPALRRWCTPPSDEPVTVNVPPGTGNRCMVALASVPESERVTWRRHKIRSGENLSIIAEGYGTSVGAILQVNSIRNPNRIRAGDHLIIPVGPGSDGTQYASAGESISHRVSRGDTVSSIARRYGKRTADVLAWNGLGWNSRIYPGDVITIRNL
ncbi:MAG: transglycosylase SLT domain-containing protein [Candidatus Eisenbacteria bacterium]